MYPFISYRKFKAHRQNLPKDCSGVYVLTNLVNGKKYVGESVNVAKRITDHSSLNGHPRKLHNALRKYGLKNFLVEPVWYATEIMSDKYYQLAVESEFISLFDSIKNGYNVIPNYHQGEYGKEWSDYLKIFWTEELRRKQAEITREQFKSPARRKKQSEATLNFLKNNPEQSGRYFKEWWKSLTKTEKKAFLASREPQRLSSIKEFFDDPERVANWAAKVNTPETVEKRNKAIKEAYAKPGGKDKLLKSRKDPVYLANQRVKGKTRFATEEARQKAREAQAKIAEKHSASLKQVWQDRPRLWITDGTVNRHHFTNLPIPEGWWQGRSGLLGRALAKQRLALVERTM